MLVVFDSTNCSVRMPYHQKLLVIKNSKQAPNRNRHLRSRLVSPNMRLNVRYDIASTAGDTEGVTWLGDLHKLAKSCQNRSLRRLSESSHSNAPRRAIANRPGCSFRWIPDALPAEIVEVELFLRTTPGRTSAEVADCGAIARFPRRNAVVPLEFDLDAKEGEVVRF